MKEAPIFLIESNAVSVSVEHVLLEGFFRSGERFSWATYFSFPCDNVLYGHQKAFLSLRNYTPGREPLPFFTLSDLLRLDVARSSFLGPLPLNLPHLAPPPWCSQTANTSLTMTFPYLEPARDSHSLWKKIKTYFSKHMGFEIWLLPTSLPLSSNISLFWAPDILNTASQNWPGPHQPLRFLSRRSLPLSCLVRLTYL